MSFHETSPDMSRQLVAFDFVYIVDLLYLDVLTVSSTISLPKCQFVCGNLILVHLCLGVGMCSLLIL